MVIIGIFEEREVKFMTEDLILNEESVASGEQAVSDEPITAKKAYVTPQMEIEYFDIEDVIATSPVIQEDVNQERTETIDDNDPDNGFY